MMNITTNRFFRNAFLKPSVQGIRQGVLTLVLMFSFTLASVAQSRNIGSVSDFKTKLNNSNKAARGEASIIQTTDEAYPVVLNKSSIVNETETLVGEVAGNPGSHFIFTIVNGKLEGILFIPLIKKAYRFYTDDHGYIQVEIFEINELICAGYSRFQEPTGNSRVEAVPPSTSPVYKLQSLPGATAVAYLDFDGEVSTTSYWNGGNTINAQPGNFSETDITNIFNLVSEDYRPFKINITTDLAVFQAAPVNRRMQCIFTPNDAAAPGSGGVAYLKSFSWNNDTPCWVFNSGSKAGGEAASHELGHSFGLSHDGRTSPSEDYYSGHGIWAPIMGVGYSKGLSQWSKGEYPNASKTEDDVAIISNTTNGFGYKTDEDGGTTTTAKALVIGTTGTVSASQNAGVITTRTDVDYYSFTTGGGSVTLTASPSPTYPDLDIQLQLVNAAGTVLATANPTAAASGSQGGTNPLTGLAASTTVTLAAGTYYLTVDGVGQGDLVTGYSDYASIGAYSISGTVPVATGNLAPVVTLTAPANGTNYTAPATVNIAATATDDGAVAKVDFYNGTTLIGTDATSPYTFTWTPVAAGNYTINAIATDNLGLVSTTASVSITVNTANQPPVVTITSPANGASFVAPASITINATATDNGSVTKVDFYNGATLLGTDATSPYSFTWTNVAAGSYTLRAVASDNQGLTATASITVQVSATNQAPVVTITSPANGAVFTSPATVTINATASDDGSVSSVAFYNGSVLLSTDLTSPYSYSWTNVGAGSFTIRAVATDNTGLTTTASVTIQVNTPPTAVVTVYKDCNYSTSGYAVNLPVGNYTLSQLRSYGILNDDISSLKVLTGYELVLYLNDNFGGTALLFRSNDPCLVDNNFNDAASSARVRVSTAGAAASEASPSISAFPNPASDEVTINFNNMDERVLTVVILDSYGQQLSSQQVSNGGQLNLTGLPTGVYSLRAVFGQQLIVTKIIKR